MGKVKNVKISYPVALKVFFFLKMHSLYVAEIAFAFKVTRQNNHLIYLIFQDIKNLQIIHLIHQY